MKEKALARMQDPDTASRKAVRCKRDGMLLGADCPFAEGR
jgi:hypothetical protein